MNRLANIGSLLKRIHRYYSADLIQTLSTQGFVDLRPSFLDVLLAICENEGASIKAIGEAVGLKKQTMTSHLNELEKRGYIRRELNESDRREQNVFLTEYGQRFKLSLNDSVSILDKTYSERIGELELERIQLILENFHQEMNNESQLELLQP